MYFYEKHPMTEIRHYRHEICCLSPSRSTKKVFFCPHAIKFLRRRTDSIDIFGHFCKNPIRLSKKHSTNNNTHRIIPTGVSYITAFLHRLSVFAAKCSNGQRKQLRASHDLIYHKVLICTVHVIIYT